MCPTLGSVLGTRTCSTCGFPKPLDDFSQRPNGKLGHRGQCKECRQQVFARQRARQKLERTRQTLRQIVNADSDATVVRLALALLHRFRDVDQFVASLQMQLLAERSNRDYGRAIFALAKIVATGTRIDRRQWREKERQARAEQLRDEAEAREAEALAEQERIAEHRRRILEEHAAFRRESEEREQEGDAQPAGWPPNVIVGDATDAELLFEQAQLRRRGALDVVGDRGDIYPMPPDN